MLKGNKEEEVWLWWTDVHITSQQSDILSWAKRRCGLENTSLWRWAAVTHSAQYLTSQSITAHSLWLLKSLVLALQITMQVSRTWSFARENQQSLTQGWKSTELPDTPLDTDSQWKSLRKNALFYAKASVNEGWARLVLMGAPSKALVAFLWLGKQIELTQYPGRDALLGILSSDMLWPRLTALSYYFLPFPLEIFGVFNKGISGIKRKEKQRAHFQEGLSHLPSSKPW